MNTETQVSDSCAERLAVWSRAHYEEMQGVLLAISSNSPPHRMAEIMTFVVSNATILVAETDSAQAYIAALMLHTSIRCLLEVDAPSAADWSEDIVIIRDAMTARCTAAELLGLDFTHEPISTLYVDMIRGSLGAVGFIPESYTGVKAAERKPALEYADAVVRRFILANAIEAAPVSWQYGDRGWVFDYIVSLAAVPRVFS